MRLLSLLAALALLGGAGCSISQIAADATAGALAEAAPATRAFFDYETAGAAAANGILQLEALRAISPDNEELALTLAQGYVVYAFGWVNDAYEIASFNFEYEEADRHQYRAYLMYLRATRIMQWLMMQQDDGFMEAAIGDPDEFKAYLREHFGDPEDDIELVFWMAIAWGSAVTNAPGMDDFVDMSAVKALAQHAMLLDEGYENAGAVALLAGIDCSYPEQYGGNWKRGTEYFERALELSGRKSHLHHINYARTCAVNMQDEELFMSLLMEVIDAEDQGDAYRLSNKVARRRAERYIKHRDQWFY
jgi:hypothetical protein